MPPDYVRQNRLQLDPILSLEPGLPPPADPDVANGHPEPEGSQATNPEPEDDVEDEVQRKLSHLVSVFPNTGDSLNSNC